MGFFMSTKLQIQLQHDDDGFLIGKKRIKTLENTVAATHKNSETILNHIKIQKSGQRMVVSGRLRLDGSSQGQSTPTTQRKPIVQTNRPRLANTSNKAQQIGNANTAHPLANQGEHQKKKQLTREQRRYRDAQARSNHRQELMLKEINKNLKNNRSSLLSWMGKLLPLLGMLASSLGFLSAGGGLLRNLLKSPLLIPGRNPQTPRRPPTSPNPSVPPIAPPNSNPSPAGPSSSKWEILKQGLKLIGKGGALSALFALFEGISVEQSDLERHEKNKEHAKNFAVAGGGVAGAMAGGAAGAAIGSVVPVLGTAVGGVVGAILGGLGGSTLTEYFVERVDKAIDKDLSKKMFGSWKGFIDVAKSGASHLWQSLIPSKFQTFFDKLGIDSSSLWSTVKGLADTTWKGIGIAGIALWKTIVPEKVQVFFDKLTSLGKEAFDAFKEGFNRLFEAIAKTPVGQTISEGWNTVSRYAGDAWEKTKQFVGVGDDKNMYSMDAGAETPKRQNMGSMDAGVEVPKSNQQAQPNGRKLTTWQDLKLKRVDANFKGKTVTESIGGGKTEQGTIEFAKTMQDKLGSRLHWFSAFNDVWHQVNSKNSKHTQGLKFDMTLNNQSGNKASEAEGRNLAPKIVQEMHDELKKQGFKDKKDYIIRDEYTKPSGKATAGHIDFEWQSKEAAARYANMVTGNNKPTTQHVNQQSGQGTPSNANATGRVLQLTDQDIENLIKVTDTEVVKFKDQATFEAQANGVMDTLLNRLESGVWGNSMSDVANAKNQFTKINGPKGYYANGKWVDNNPYGSVQNMPSSAVSARTRAYAMKYIKERENGRPSSVGSHLHYANPNMSDEKNKKAWVNDMETSARKEGMVFGAGKSIHVHGTTKDLQSRRPGAFRVSLGSKPSQTKPKLHQVKTPPVVQPKSQQVAVNANNVALNAANIQPQEVKLPASSRGAGVAYQGSVGGQIAHAPIKRQVSHPEIANVTSGGTGA